MLANANQRSRTTDSALQASRVAPQIVVRIVNGDRHRQRCPKAEGSPRFQGLFRHATPSDRYPPAPANAKPNAPIIPSRPRRPPALQNDAGLARRRIFVVRAQDIFFAINLNPSRHRRTEWVPTGHAHKNARRVAKSPSIFFTDKRRCHRTPTGKPFAVHRISGISPIAGPKDPVRP